METAYSLAMPSRLGARLLALAALLVLVALDVVLFPTALSRATSLVFPHAVTTPTSTPRPPTTATPTPYGPLPITAAYNNVGIGLDGANSADFDGLGYSYSEQALTAARLSPGTAVTSGGVQYVMPDLPAARPDNVRASGQTILAPNLPGATLLGFLGAATEGESSGTVTITYTDGTTQAETLTFSDWTLGGGSSSMQPGNVIVAASAYRKSGTSQDQTTTYVFASVPMQLRAGKDIQSVQLPTSVTGGTMHVFSIGTDKGAFS